MRPDCDFLWRYGRALFAQGGPGGMYGLLEVVGVEDAGGV